MITDHLSPMFGRTDAKLTLDGTHNGRSLRARIGAGPSILGEVILAPEDAERAAIHILRWLGDTSDDRTITALFIGGPLHSTWRAVPREDREVRAVSLSNATATSCASGSRVNISHQQDHRYRRADDLGWGDAKLPFVIYEHESLWDANVSREAERLDKELAQAEARYDALWRPAHDASVRVTKLRQQRLALQAQHGI